MQAISIDFTAQMAPTAIMVIYTGNNDSYVEVASLRKEGNKFVPLPMVPLTQSLIRSMKAIFDPERDTVDIIPEVIPAELLFYDFSYGRKVVCWHIPPKKRKIVFDKGAGVKTMEVVPPPTILIVNDEDLHVFCYKGKKRPVASTMLYDAPYFNTSVFGGKKGKICLGANRLNSTYQLSKVMERGTAILFEAPFTHFGGSYDKPTQLWQEAKKKGVFPEDKLKKQNQTLGKLLSEFITPQKR